MIDTEHSLHLWKKHTCTSTAERQLPNWQNQVRTWSYLRGQLYSQNILCLLIQSHCTELQSWINILMLTTRIFDHPVVYIRVHTFNPFICGDKWEPDDGSRVRNMRKLWTEKIVLKLCKCGQQLYICIYCSLYIYVCVCALHLFILLPH
jgi:hypothetical protein